MSFIAYTYVCQKFDTVDYNFKRKNTKHLYTVIVK